MVGAICIVSTGVVTVVALNTGFGNNIITFNQGSAKAIPSSAGLMSFPRFNVSCPYLSEGLYCSPQFQIPIRRNAMKRLLSLAGAILSVGLASARADLAPADPTYKVTATNNSGNYVLDLLVTFTNSGNAIGNPTVPKDGNGGPADIISIGTGNNQSAILAQWSDTTPKANVGLAKTNKIIFTFTDPNNNVGIDAAQWSEVGGVAGKFANLNLKNDITIVANPEPSEFVPIVLIVLTWLGKRHVLFSK